MTFPLHPAPAPADVGEYDRLEVDPWPHIHTGTDGIDVIVRLHRYRDDRGSWFGDRSLFGKPLDYYERIVHRPSWFARVFRGDTLERRIRDAAQTIERRYRAGERADADTRLVVELTRRP